MNEKATQLMINSVCTQGSRRNYHQELPSLCPWAAGARAARKRGGPAHNRAPNYSIQNPDIIEIATVEFPPVTKATYLLLLVDVPRRGAGSLNRRARGGANIWYRADAGQRRNQNTVKGNRRCCSFLPSLALRSEVYSHQKFTVTSKHFPCSC